MRELIVWQAEMVDEPLEIFIFMKSHDIGTKHAIFYEAWAAALEEQGNVSGADKLFQEGIAKLVARRKPPHVLQH